MHFIPSPAVRSYLLLRMDAAHGTPTVWEKLGAVFGLDGASNAEVLAGDMRDLSAAEHAVLALFKPILSQAESSGLGDLVNMLQGILTLIPSVSSVGGAVKIIETVLAAEAGPLAEQAKTLGQTSLTTLVSAALAALGKNNLPA